MSIPEFITSPPNLRHYVWVSVEIPRPELIAVTDQPDHASAEPPAEWTEPERAMWVAFRNGGELDLRDPDPTQNIPASGADWGAKRTLRAEVISQILLQPPRVELGNPDRFRLTGARISGKLDLGCGAVIAFLFSYCRFDDSINLSDASAAFVGFTHCYFPGIMADRLKCSGPVWLDQSESPGLTDLEDSVIQGEVSLVGVKLHGQEDAHRVCVCGATINGDLFLTNAVISGHIGLHSTIVNGSISFDATEITGNPLTVKGRLVKVAGDVSALNSFKSMGQFNMEGAYIGGQLLLRGANLSNHGGTVLDLDHARIELGLYAREIVTDGKILIHHANVGCQVAFVDACLSHPKV